MATAALTLQEAKNRFLGAPGATGTSPSGGGGGYTKPGGGTVRFADALLLQFLPPLPSDGQRRESALYAASAASMLSALSASTTSDLLSNTRSPYARAGTAGSAAQGSQPKQQMVPDDPATVQQATSALANVLRQRREVKQQTLELYVALGNASRFLFHDLFLGDGETPEGFFPLVHDSDGPLGLEAFDELVSTSVAPGLAVPDRELLAARLPLPPSVDAMLRAQDDYDQARVAEAAEAVERAHVDDAVRQAAFQNQHRFLFMAGGDSDGGAAARDGDTYAPFQTLARQQLGAQNGKAAAAAWGKDGAPSSSRAAATAAGRAALPHADPFRVLAETHPLDDMHRLLEIETIDCQVMLSYIMHATATYHRDGVTALPTGGGDDGSGSSSVDDQDDEDDDDGKTPNVTAIESFNHGTTMLSQLHFGGGAPQPQLLQQSQSNRASGPPLAHVASSKSARLAAADPFTPATVAVQQQQHQQQPASAGASRGVFAAPQQQSAQTSIFASTTYPQQQPQPQQQQQQEPRFVTVRPTAANASLQNSSGTTSGGTSHVINQSATLINDPGTKHDKPGGSKAKKKQQQGKQHSTFTMSTNTTTSTSTSSINQSGVAGAGGGGGDPRASPAIRPGFVDLSDLAAAQAVLQQQNNSSSTERRDTSTQRTGVATSRRSKTGSVRSGSRKSSSGGLFSCFRRSASSSSSSSAEEGPGPASATLQNGQQR